MKLKTIAVALAVASLPLAAQVRVLASNGMRAVMEQLKPQSERAAGKPLMIEYGTSTSLKARIDAGEVFDVAMMTSDLIDQLVKSGKLSAVGRADIARAGIGVGIRKGAAKPDLRTGEAYKRTLVNAKSITYAGDGASRTFLERGFERMGIGDAMKAKTRLEQGSTQAAALVANGGAELLLTLVSEILPAPGVELAGPIPAEYQSYVSFAAGVGAKSGDAAAAGAIVKLLSGPAVSPVLKSKGMESVK